jgi:hypothetical protein
MLVIADRLSLPTSFFYEKGDRGDGKKERWERREKRGDGDC